MAERVANKLQSEEKLITAYGGVRVRMDLDRVPLWRDSGDITVADLWSAYANHPYMARLANFDVLAAAISNGTASMSWETETFAYADAKENDTWFGVTYGSHVTPMRSGLVMRPDIVGTDTPEPDVPDGSGDSPDEPGGVPSGAGSTGSADARTGGGADGSGPVATRFYGRFGLDPVRGIRQLEEIMTNVTNHLGSNVKITVEVEAESPAGFDDRTRRVAEENAKQLGAEAAEFE